MECPRCALVGLLVDLHLATHRGKGHLVVIEGPIDVGVGGDGRRRVGLPQKIQRDLGLGQKFVPLAPGKVVGCLN